MKKSVILVTGCSSGLGRDLTSRLAERGHITIATARNTDEIIDVNAAMKLHMDVTSQTSVDDAVNSAIRQYGRIDVLVNNAGYAFRCAAEEISDEKMHRMFDVNVFGIIRTIRGVVPHMRARRSGRIINISSMAGKMVLPVSGAYCASKFAVEALSDSLRLELSAFGIDVAVIEPGNIRTNFMNTVMNNSRRVLSNPDSPYRDLYEKHAALNDRMRTNEPGPDIVSDVTIRAIEAFKPKPRYKAGVPFFNRIIAHSGDRIKDRIVKSLFGIAPQRET